MYARTRDIQGLAPRLGLLHLELHRLALHEKAEALALDLRLVHEDVLPVPVLRGDEAEALRGVGL